MAKTWHSMGDWKKLTHDKISTPNSIKQKSEAIEYAREKYVLKYGLMTNLVVIQKGDKYEIVDGREIYLTARKTGVEEFICYVVEDNAELHRVMLNTLFVRNDVVELSELVNSLDDKQLKLLPFDQATIETFKTLLDFDWNEYHNEATKNQQKLF